MHYYNSLNENALTNTTTIPVSSTKAAVSSATAVQAAYANRAAAGTAVSTASATADPTFCHPGHQDCASCA